ncbi:MAG: YdcF family protein [Bacteroidetes bacterium CHB5]|nr:YdcF family protein [Bacteroidetes bacterium CHB5]
MFFILSKTINFLAMPLVLVCLFWIASRFIQHSQWKKRLALTALILLLIISNDFITNEVALLWEPPATPYHQISKKYKLGILLTGVTKSNMQPDDRIYFQRGADRVTHTLQLYKLGIIEKILVSGGSGSLTKRARQEADEIAEALLLMGVPETDILIENQSRNTHESAVAVKAMLQNRYQPTDCLLITSAYHMYRSDACFKKAGWPCDTFTCDFLSHNRKFTPDVLFIPKAESVTIWTTLMREWAGLVAYKFSGYI